MFKTTHDVILLVIAALYVLVFVARIALRNPPRDRRGRETPGWYTVPMLIAAALVIVAVLW